MPKMTGTVWNLEIRYHPFNLKWEWRGYILGQTILCQHLWSKKFLVSDMGSTWKYLLINVLVDKIVAHKEISKSIVCCTANWKQISLEKKHSPSPFKLNGWSLMIVNASLAWFNQCYNGWLISRSDHMRSLRTCVSIAIVVSERGSIDKSYYS